MSDQSIVDLVRSRLQEKLTKARYIDSEDPERLDPPRAKEAHVTAEFPPSSDELMEWSRAPTDGAGPVARHNLREDEGAVMFHIMIHAHAHMDEARAIWREIRDAFLGREFEALNPQDGRIEFYAAPGGFNQTKPEGRWRGISRAIQYRREYHYL